MGVDVQDQSLPGKPKGAVTNLRETVQLNFGRIAAQSYPSIWVLFGGDPELMDFLMKNEEIWKGVLRVARKYKTGELAEAAFREYIYNIFLTKDAEIYDNATLIARLEKSIIKNTQLHTYAENTKDDIVSWIETSPSEMRQWDKRQLKERIILSLGMDMRTPEDKVVKKFQKLLPEIKSYLRSIDYIDVDELPGLSGEIKFISLDQVVDTLYANLRLENGRHSSWMSRFIQAMYAWADLGKILHYHKNAENRLTQLKTELSQGNPPWVFEHPRGSDQEQDGIMYKFHFSLNGKLINGVLGLKPVRSILIKLMSDPLYLGVDAIRDMIRGSIFFDNVEKPEERKNIILYVTQMLFQENSYILKDKGLLGEAIVEDLESSLSLQNHMPFHTSQTRKARTNQNFTNASTSGFSQKNGRTAQVGIEMQYYESEQGWEDMNYFGMTSHSILNVGKCITGWARGQGYLTEKQIIARLIEEEASLSSGVSIPEILSSWIHQGFVVVYRQGETLYFGVKEYEYKLTQIFPSAKKVTDYTSIAENIQTMADWGQEQYRSKQD